MLCKLRYTHPSQREFGPPVIWPTLVSLRNRTTGRSGRQNTCVWQTWHCYFLRVLSWSSFNDNVFWSLPKDPFKGKWCLAKRNFKQNYCHAWHTKIKVFVPLPSCCVSSLLTRCSSIQQAISEFQNPHYQNQAKWKKMRMWKKKSFICMRIKTNFHINGFFLASL